MELVDLILPAACLGAAALVVYSGWRFYQRYYQAVPPNRALVLFGGHRGGTRAAGDSSPDSQSARIVVGGGVLVPPWRRGSDSLSLSPIDVDLRVLVSSSSGVPDEAPWEVRLATRVKIPNDPRMLAAAAENLLGRSDPEIGALVARTLESVAPAVLLRELTSDPGIDWDRLAASLQAAVGPELVAVGLEVRTLSVTQVRRLTNRDRPDTGLVPASQLSRDLLWASGDLGVRLRSNEVRLERTERSLGLLGAEVMRMGQDGSRFPVLPALQPYNSTGDERSSEVTEPDPKGVAPRRPAGSTRPLLDAEG